MSHLQTLLDDVLCGRRVVRDPTTFRLLKRFTPDRAVELNELEVQISKTHDTPKKQNTMKKEHNLTRRDVEAIYRQERPTTIDEIEWLLAHANDPRILLSVTDETRLRSLATRLLADQHIAEARTDEFAAKTLGIFRTSHGDLSQAEVTRLEQIRIQAAQGIQGCKEHRRDRCLCWKAARAALFEIRQAAGEKTAFGMAALAVWNWIEEFARSRREPTDSQAKEPPPGIMYNWRAYKCPEYMASLQQ